MCVAWACFSDGKRGEGPSYEVTDDFCRSGLGKMTGQSTLQRLGLRLGSLKARYPILPFNLSVGWYTSSQPPMASVSAPLGGCYLGTWFFDGEETPDK